MNTAPIPRALIRVERPRALTRFSLRFAAVAGFATLGWCAAVWLSSTAFAAADDAVADNVAASSSPVSSVLGVVADGATKTGADVAGTLSKTTATVDGTLSGVDDPVSTVAEVVETGVGTVTKTVDTVTTTVGTVTNTVDTVVKTVDSVTGTVTGQLSQVAGGHVDDVPQPGAVEPGTELIDGATSTEFAQSAVDQADDTDEAAKRARDVGGVQYRTKAGPVRSESSIADRMVAEAKTDGLSNELPADQPSPLAASGLPGVTVSPQQGNDTGSKHAILTSHDGVSDCALASAALRGLGLGAGEDAALPCASPD